MDQQPKLPPFPKRDMTLAELKQYDGKADKRILIALNRDIFDCTQAQQFYGPEGPYSSLAGHDASRALATFNVDAVKDEWDDTSDLLPSQVSTVDEWHNQFKEKYPIVGKLVETEAKKVQPVDLTDE